MYDIPHPHSIIGWKSDCIHRHLLRDKGKSKGTSEVLRQVLRQATLFTPQKETHDTSM